MARSRFVSRRGFVGLSAGALAGAVLAACGGTMFLGPLGAEMPRAWLSIMRLSLPDVIQEHGRLDFTRPEAWMVVAMGLGYGLILWRTPGWRSNPACRPQVRR